MIFVPELVGEFSIRARPKPVYQSPLPRLRLVLDEMVLTCIFKSFQLRAFLSVASTSVSVAHQRFDYYTPRPSFLVGNCYSVGIEWERNYQHPR
jgi:hypothetical protein